MLFSYLSAELLISLELNLYCFTSAGMVPLGMHPARRSVDFTFLPNASKVEPTIRLHFLAIKLEAFSLIHFQRWIDRGE